MKPKKAYLLQEAHRGFGFRVSPCLVVDHRAGEKLALVMLVNIGPESSYVPVIARPGIWVSVDDLASTRLKALAKIALRLRDLEERLFVHTSLTPDA